MKLGRPNQFLGAAVSDTAIVCAEVVTNGGRPIVRRTATFTFPAGVSLETPDAAGQALAGFLPGLDSAILKVSPTNVARAGYRASVRRTARFHAWMVRFQHLAAHTPDRLRATLGRLNAHPAIFHPALRRYLYGSGWVV